MQICLNDNLLYIIALCYILFLLLTTSHATYRACTFLMYVFCANRFISVELFIGWIIPLDYSSRADSPCSPLFFLEYTSLLLLSNSLKQTLPPIGEPSCACHFFSFLLCYDVCINIYVFPPLLHAV